MEVDGFVLLLALFAAVVVGLLVWSGVLSRKNAQSSSTRSPRRPPGEKAPSAKEITHAGSHARIEHRVRSQLETYFGDYKKYALAVEYGLNFVRQQTLDSLAVPPTTATPKRIIVPSDLGIRSNEIRAAEEALAEVIASYAQREAKTPVPGHLTFGRRLDLLHDHSRARARLWALEQIAPRLRAGIQPTFDQVKKQVEQDLQRVSAQLWG